MDPAIARNVRKLEAARRGYGVEAMHTYGCKVGGMSSALCPAAPKRSVYSYAPRWDFVPSGRLEFHAGHPDSRTPLGADRTRFGLEDRLGRVFVKLEAIAQAAEDRRRAEEERRLAAVREAERRREAWKLAMHVAAVRYVEHTKAKALLDQIDRRQNAATIREFLKLASEKANTVEEKQWLEWAADYADAIAPFLQPLVAPEVAEPTVGDLGPFLDGWSPYGPEDRMYRH